MMSIEYIQSQSRKAARESQKAGKGPLVIEPYMLNDLDMLTEDLSRIPFLGDRTPKGWRKIDTLFVDSSGFGAEYEPAMTFRQFAMTVMRNGAGKAYSIAQAGQFQVYINVFQPTGGAK